MDVMITTHALLRSGERSISQKANKRFSFWLLLGMTRCIRGVSNAFLTHSKHQYFLEFGADGLQEKRSVRHIFGLLDKHRILVIEDGMGKDLQEEIIGARNLIEQSILWTDIARHKEQIKKIEALVPQINSSLEKARGGDNRVSAKEQLPLICFYRKKRTRFYPKNRFC